MRPFFCLFAILAILHPLAAAARSGMAGGWKLIKDINDPHVKEIAEFAVSKYNSRVSEHVKGETQVVVGENYRLVIAIKDN
ncbi:cysteine proteinase inhibitor 5-like [Rosa rugosa]|uniref:cysteine proteinase inhibitor 5-like n=1 Tax=Rosa rugosa TaxID=74645 RepID=UPI002B4165D0|nr:cysteine proteinase inhibitor 5-like [Rosa rugosa]